MRPGWRAPEHVGVGPRRVGRRLVGGRGGRVGSSGQVPDEKGAHRCLERRLPGRDRPDGAAGARRDQHLWSGSRRRRAQEGFDDRLVVGEGREHEDGDLGVRAHDQSRRLGAGELGHAEIHQHDIGADLVDEADRSRPVTGLPRDLEALDERQQGDGTPSRTMA